MGLHSLPAHHTLCPLLGQEQPSDPGGVRTRDMVRAQSEASGQKNQTPEGLLQCGHREQGSSARWPWGRCQVRSGTEMEDVLVATRKGPWSRREMHREPCGLPLVTKLANSLISWHCPSSMLAQKGSWSSSGQSWW